MATAPKDTIYIDIDDEITTIIDKVQGSAEKIVALVLPKRSTALQSVVNMKLLRRTADEAKKHIVLITSDNNLLPLAGMVGFYVAKTLQTRPVVPPAPTLNDAPISVAEDEQPLIMDDEAIDPTKPIGVLAGMDGVSDDDETIELDNDQADAAVPLAVADEAAPKKSFNKKLKVPNFERFRILVAFGVLLIIGLAVFSYFAIKVWPKASVVIKTDTTSVNTNVTFTAATAAKTVDTAKLVVPATQKQLPKTDKQDVKATGQRDEGKAAKGTLVLTNCINDGQPHTVPAGTGFSVGQFTFSTDSAITLDPALFSGSTCKSATFGLSKSVSVTANSVGDSYNLSSRAYTSPINGISAAGSDMTGGVSKIVKIVAQADIDAVKQKIQDAGAAGAASEIKQQFQAEGSIALPETFSAAAPTVNASPAAGEQADQTTVTVAVTYSMNGIKKSDLGKLIEADIKKRIDTSKQKITNNGLDQATLKVLDKANPSSIKTEIQTTATAGAEQNADVIKKLIAGKKSGDAKNTIKERPGIQEVTVKLSPFWVTKVPKDQAKVTVSFQSLNGRN